MRIIFIAFSVIALILLAMTMIVAPSENITHSADAGDFADRPAGNFQYEREHA